MKTFFVALFFVALASAQVDNVNFIQRHKRAVSRKPFVLISN